MGRTRDLEAVIYIVDESLPTSTLGGKHSLLPLFHAYDFLNRAREAGVELEFTTKGPDAERALELLIDTIENPPTGPEARFGAFEAAFSPAIFQQARLDAEFNGGKPSPMPDVRDAPPRTIQSEIRKRLKGWGLLEDWDAMTGRKRGA